MDTTQTTRRRDWQLMQRKVARAFVDLYRQNQQQPTNAELAKEVGVSERTVIRHLKEVDFSSHFDELRAPFATMLPNVMIAIYNSAIKGKVPAQKLFLQIVFGWAEPKVYEQPERQSEYVSEDELAKLERGIDLLVDMKIRRRDFDKMYEKSD
tara:strand:+ start:34 stop:492 length:459 start_codon:yes stop_codon:yes gene_type:complete